MLERERGRGGETTGGWGKRRLEREKERAEGGVMGGREGFILGTENRSLRGGENQLFTEERPFPHERPC